MKKILGFFLASMMVLGLIAAPGAFAQEKRPNMHRVIGAKDNDHKKGDPKEYEVTTENIHIVEDIKGGKGGKDNLADMMRQLEGMLGEKGGKVNKGIPVDDEYNKTPLLEDKKV